MPDGPLFTGVIESFARWLWQTSWQAAAVAVLVLLLRGSIGRVMTRRWRHALWAIVLLRLLLPGIANSRFSLFTATDFVRSEWAARRHASPGRPSIDTSWKVIIEGGAGPVRIPSNAIQSADQQIAATPIWNNLAISLIAVWFVGAIFFGARLVIANIRFSQRLRGSLRASDGRVNRCMTDCCKEMRIAQSPEVLLTEIVSTPAVTGLLRNRLLIAPDVCRQLSDEQLRLVFLHELAHIKCHDVAVDWVWAILQAIHWFNPVLWLINSPRRCDREQARDEMVLSLNNGADTERYGRTILELAVHGRPRALCAGILGMVNRRRDLEARINMIAGFTPPRPVLRGVGLLVVVLAGCAALTNPPAKAQPASAPSTEAPATDENSGGGGADTAESPKDSALRAALDRPVPVAQFDADAFGDTINWVADLCNTDIYVDWGSLDREHIHRESPVTLKARNTTFSQLLQSIFKQVEGKDEESKLDYTIEHGVITISSVRELNKQVETRRYDINDLLFVPADYANLPPADGKQAKDAWAIRQARIKEVERFIMANVAPTTWKENGGDTASIQSSQLRSILLISATPKNHALIEQVLNDLRANQELQVSIETRFLSLDDASMAKLPDALRARLLAATHAQSAPNDDNLISDADFSELVQAVNASRQNLALTAPRLTVFSGQRARVVVGLETPYIESMSPSAVVQTKGTEILVSYEPKMGKVNTGVSLDCLATVTADGKYVLLDVSDAISTVDSLVQEPWAGAGPGANVFIQWPMRRYCVLRFSQKIPGGTPILLGTFEQSRPKTTTDQRETKVKDPEGFVRYIDAARDHQLFCIVKATILPDRRGSLQAKHP